MEMVQFHPTGLLAGAHTRMTGTVLEEGLRGAGGYLLDRTGRRFMFDYDDRGERATRDIVSRAIYAEMSKSNSPADAGMFISMSHLGPELVAEKFKGMVKRCADCGFNLAAGQVEVVPTAHYLMGGVIVDVDTRTEIEGLYAAGEDAGGAHGANRLGGNGVANSTVFGGIAGEVMAADIAKLNSHRPADETVLEEEIERACQPFRKKAEPIQPLRQSLQDIAWEDIGVIRNKSSLKKGLERISELSEQMAEIGVADGDRAFHLGWHDWLNLRSLIDTTKVIGEAALARENSRGAHFRQDFPDTGELETSYFTVARLTSDGVSVTRQDVDFSIVSPGHTILSKDEPETLVAAQ